MELDVNVIVTTLNNIQKTMNDNQKAQAEKQDAILDIINGVKLDVENVNGKLNVGDNKFKYIEDKINTCTTEFKDHLKNHEHNKEHKTSITIGITGLVTGAIYYIINLFNVGK